MTPRTEAIAFRIWQHCEPLGWDCYARDVAEELNISFGTMRNIITQKGWAGRFRTKVSGFSDGNIAFAMDDAIDGFSNKRALHALVGGAA